MFKKKLQYGVFALLCLLAGWAVAAPQVSLEMTVEKEVVENTGEAEPVVSRVEAGNAEPGETLYYTIRYHNSGTEPARNVKLDNPVPDGTAYISGSAWGDNSEILFSADGSMFKRASNLTYRITNSDGSTEERRVSPEQYNAIRWIVEEIGVGESGTAGFSVTVQ